MPPKRKHSAEATIRYSKRSQESNRHRYHEQNADDESEPPSDASAWPPSSSYSDASNLHGDDTSQYSDITPMFIQPLRRSGRLDLTMQEPALVTLDLAIDEGIDLPKPLTATCDAIQAVFRIVQVDEDD
ncbi:hypothetical protein FRC19_002974 [Serendipita sp. 401]|nr:hypothetical protein FRC19_002974 [Serendipita sp. 401]